MLNIKSKVDGLMALIILYYTGCVYVEGCIVPSDVICSTTCCGDVSHPKCCDNLPAYNGSVCQIKSRQIITDPNATDFIVCKNKCCGDIWKPYCCEISKEKSKSFSPVIIIVLVVCAPVAVVILLFVCDFKSARSIFLKRFCHKKIIHDTGNTTFAPYVELLQMSNAAVNNNTSGTAAGGTGTDNPPSYDELGIQNIHEQLPAYDSNSEEPPPAYHSLQLETEPSLADRSQDFMTNPTNYPDCNT